MLERFTKERQRAAKNAAFNLEDEDELTHYGQSLSKMADFDDAGLDLGDEDEESDGVHTPLSISCQSHGIIIQARLTRIQ